MTQSEKDLNRVTNLIMRHADLYDADPQFRRMVDNTVFISDFDREQSEREIGRVYGSVGYGESARET